MGRRRKIYGYNWLTISMGHLTCNMLHTVLSPWRIKNFSKQLFIQSILMDGVCMLSLALRRLSKACPWIEHRTTNTGYIVLFKRERLYCHWSVSHYQMSLGNSRRQEVRVKIVKWKSTFCTKKQTIVRSHHNNQTACMETHSVLYRV